MRAYIALIHKQPDSPYGVSFPDVPGVISAADSLDEALAEAAEVLAFAAEDWAALSGHSFPQPRTVDELAADPEFAAELGVAIVAVVPLNTGCGAAA